MSRIAALLAIMAAPPAAAETVSATGYREQLRELSQVLAARQLDEARARARAMLDARVTHGAEQLPADRTILAPVLSARDGDELALARRVDAAVVALETLDGTPVPPHSGDRTLLERLDGGERRREPGGRVGSVLPPLTLSERAAAWLSAAGEALSELARWLVDGLRSLWPRRATKTSPVSAGGPALAVVVAALALLALLAWRVWRSGLPGDAELEGSAAPAASDRDEDPLSRGASEWQRHAEALARQGRLREAVRAWYHAVLVTSFARGALHHRRGRTNWEYASSLSPELAWRPAFLHITRDFDRQWYGGAPVDREAFQAYVGRAKHVLGRLPRSTDT